MARSRGLVPVLVEVGAHPGGRVAALGLTVRRCGGLRHRIPNFLVWLPELPARDLQHLDIIRLITVADRADGLHGGRSQHDGRSILRPRHVRHDRHGERNARDDCFPKPDHGLSPIERTQKLKLAWPPSAGGQRPLGQV
jgi:hypothetical protein